jgi:ApeA N-terminal domain 1
MADRALNEAFDAFGEWHLPETPEQQIAGTLRYSPDRTELHLNEAFQPLRGPVRVGDYPQPYAAIYGTSREGEAMTLLNARRMGVSFAFGSGGLRQPERVLSSLLLVGAHVPPGFLYPKIRFRVPGLQVWLSKPIVEQSHQRDEGTGSLTFSYHVRGLPKETTRVPCIDASLPSSCINIHADRHERA